MTVDLDNSIIQLWGDAPEESYTVDLLQKRQFVTSIGHKYGTESTIIVHCDCDYTYEAYGNDAPERASAALMQHVRDKHLRKLRPWAKT